MVSRESRIIYFNHKHPLEVQLSGPALKEVLEIDYPATVIALQNEELYTDRELVRLLAEAEAERFRSFESFEGGHVGALRLLWRDAVLETFNSPPLLSISRPTSDPPRRPNHDLNKWDGLVMAISRELDGRPKRRKDAEAARRRRLELERRKP